MSNTLIFIIHGVLSFTCAIRVIYSRRSSSAAMAWLAVLFALPIIGLLVYLLIGEPKLGRRRAARALEMRAFYRSVAQQLDHMNDMVAIVDKRFQQIAYFGREMNGLAATGGNSTQLLSITDEILNTLKTDIVTAKISCFLEFYIVDGQGRVAEILTELEKAALRGVDCRLLADALGSRTFWESQWVERLRAAGVKLCEALPVGVLKSLWVRSDLRNHRKIVLIDSEIAYTGSFNLIDPKWFKQDEGVGEWVDAVLRMQGSVVSMMSSVFYADWAEENDEQLQATLIQLNDLIKDKSKLLPNKYQEDALLQVFPSQPGGDSYALYDMLVCALHSAQHSIVMTTPYFVPDESLLAAMITAARRGVSVKLIVPEKNDSMLVYYASSAYYPPLLEAGVEVLQFSGGLLHTKSVLIDNQFALFGTVNIDMRSFYLNLEVSVAIYDATTVEKINQLQQSYMQHCRPVYLQKWQQQNYFLRRLAERCVRLMSPLL